MKSYGKYYRKDLEKLYKFLVPKGISFCRIRTLDQKISGKQKYILLDNVIGRVDDIQLYLTKLHKHAGPDTRLIITYYNHLWEPVLKLASRLGFRKPNQNQNWLNNEDLANFLHLTGYEVITKQKRFLLPFELYGISSIVNKWIAPLPYINSLCLSTWIVARPTPKKAKELSVSIVIAARNEEGNIPKIIQRIPKFGKWIEVIFVEGNSTDKTWQAVIKESQKSFKNVWKVKAYKQTGKGKGNAVRLGFEKATGEVLMILDADMTVPPEDLPKFYSAILSGKGEFINGTRLVYPMEALAMQFLNKIGNRIFGLLLTWILGQRFTDTLCGTKVLTKKHYKEIKSNRKFFGDFDPFGDFDLIFGSVKLHLKVLEIPVRYKERTYGATNISRFRHAVLLFRMTWIAFKKLRAWS